MARVQTHHFFAVALGCAMFATTAVAATAGGDILDNLGDAKKPVTPAAKPSAPAPAAEGTPASGPAVSKPAATGATASAEGKSVAAAPEALDRVKAVPRKTLLKKGRFELSPFGTLSVNDAYYQHYAAGGAAIYYPHDAFGLGVGAEYFFSHVATSNIDTVRQDFIAVPAVFEQPSLFVHVDAYFVPIYGKLSLFSNDIIQFDTYAVGGVGAAFVGSHHRPAVNLGIGQRFTFGEWFAVRLEVRDHLFVDTQTVNEIERSGVQNYVLLMAGISVFLPTSFEYTFQ